MTHQYLGLNALNNNYTDLVVLGFPCNQFGQQEPAQGMELYNGIRYVRPGGDFQPNITLFRRIEVNGVNEHRLYTFLKKQCPPTRDFFASTDKLFYKDLRNSDIRWNFEKFLINRQGKPVRRYDPNVKAEELVADIEMLLAEGTSSRQRRFRD